MAVEKQIITSAEFEQIAYLPENTDKTLELIDGEIIEKMPSNPRSSYFASLINFHVMEFVLKNDLGYVTGEQGGYVISETDTFAPDVAFISKERQPVLPYEEGYNPIPPDLAVEVISPTDSYSEVATKVATYLRYGTLLVWVFDPKNETATVHSPNGVRVLKIDDTLDGGDVLPGFKLALKDIFRR